MEREARKPGGPAGVSRLLRDVFGVSPTPSIGRRDAADRAIAAARAQGVPFVRVDVSDQPVMRGALFDAAGARVSFPEGAAFDRCYVVLLDPEPAARWAHEAHWAFVPADGEGDAALVPTSLPEATGGPVRLYPMPVEA